VCVHHDPLTHHAHHDGPALLAQNLLHLHKVHPAADPKLQRGQHDKRQDRQNGAEIHRRCGVL
jgi:hypothetical protein